VYANTAAATHAVATLNSLSDKPTGLQFKVDAADECMMLCVSTKFKKLNLNQQKWARAALHNKTTGGKSAHHVAMGTLIAVYAIVMHGCTTCVCVSALYSCASLCIRGWCSPAVHALVHVASVRKSVC
jgi:hypothetical protein